MIIVGATRAATLAAAGQQNNPFVTGQNLVPGATVTSNRAALADGPLINAQWGDTGDYWKPDMAAQSFVTYSVDFGVSTALDFVGIAAHNLGSLVAAVKVETSANGADWVDVADTIGASSNPVDDRAFGFLFTSQSSRYWRLFISGLGIGVQPVIGVIQFSRAIILPQRFYQGFSPRITPTEVEIDANVSVGNHLLGSKAITRGSTLSYDLEHLPPTFLRGADWRVFQREVFNKAQGFFTGWRPAKYPNDFDYGWRDGAAIRPVNSGPRDMMSLSMAMRIYER